MRVLADILTDHYPERVLIFTADNTMVYRISRELLIPAITHQTPVKERHEILTKFKQGTYNTLVASHVLNEGVDVPAAAVAIILSGTGSIREYTQRLGRILRKGNQENKREILYEVIAEDTSEEGTSIRRKGLRGMETPSGNKPEEKSKKGELGIVYRDNQEPESKVAQPVEINYSTKKLTKKSTKSKHQKDVTD